MLQDNLRAAVFRSLTKPLPVGWDNGNQTTECGTNRKSKTSNSAEVNNTIEGRSSHQGFETEEKAMEFREKSDLQLFQVSRGARELTQMIDSLSKAPNLNGQSKYIAKDLLRGALDLQESLDMLSKLQETSKRMSQLKLKRRSESVEEEIGVEEKMRLRRYGLQEPRLSVDGSSRNRVEDLKRMSQLKLKRRSEFMEEDIGVEEIMGSKRFGLQESRLSTDGSLRNCVDELKRTSQLISKQRSEFKEEGIGADEIMGSKRFGLQGPRLSVDGSSRKSIEELRRVIKDSLYQQNLLSISSDDERASSSQSLRSSKSSRFERFEEPSYERKKKATIFIAATPQPKKGPNLIAKLMGLDEVPTQTVHPIKMEEERKKSLNLPRPTFDIERPTARKLQLVEKKSNPKQKTLEEIIEAMQFKGLLKSSQVDDLRNKSHRSEESQLEQYSRSFSMDDEVPPIVIMKPLYLPHFEREVQKNLFLDKISVKEEIQSVELIREEKVSDHGQVLPKTFERKEVKSIEKAKVELSQRVNTLATLSHKHQRREAIKTRKILNEGQKPVLNGKKKEAKKDVKSTRALKSQAKTASTAPAKPDKRLPPANNKVSPVKPVSKNSTSSTNEKKTSGAKQVRKFTAIKTDDKKCKDGKANSLLCETNSLPTSRNLPANDLPEEAEKEAKSCNKDDGREDQKIFCEVMSKTSQEGISPELSKEVVHLPDKKPAIRKASGMENDLIRLLLSSPSFLTRAQELFGIDAHQLIYSKRKGMEDDVMGNAKLYLDCGKELMARKSHQHELLIHPMLQNQIWGLTTTLSLNQLVEEISSGIKMLTSYSKVDVSATSEDGLYVRLERDLRCKEVLVSAMWDIGWVSWVCTEEAGQAVGEVVEHILSWLIAEVAVDLVY